MAHSAPAGDEYLPEVPKAAGDEVVAAEDGGGEAGDTIVAPEARGQVDDSKSKGPSSKDSKAKGDDSDATAVQPAATTDSDDDGGSGGTLLDPVVLLLLFGAVAAAVGMLLHRRRGGEGGSGDGDRPARTRAKPATPDGEIVAGGERQS
jgi:hypothetical protein